jgi:inhibitor of cysteine peptidase
MYRFILYLTTISLLLISVTACASGKPKTVKLAEKDTGSTVNLNKGDVLEITLVGNPTTGYSWETQTLDTAVLQQKGDWEFTADNTTPGFTGSPGKFIMRFEAMGAGKTMLKLIYHRSFEPDVPPEEKFDITVVVN